MQFKEIIVACRCKWTQCFLRMTDTCILKLVFEYTQTGSRTVGRPREDGEASTLENTGMVYTILFCC
jgi:hypothetical protein